MSTVTYSQREITATRISEPIEIDGHLDEAVWKDAAIATDFITWAPEAGKTPTRKTEAKILYDDDAFYFGAQLYTESRDEIQTELSERDQIGNTDWVGLIIDTYGNGTEGFEFIVTATGGQFDAKVSIDVGEDSNWDEIWYSAVQLTDKGWYAEVKIPYSAIRFPNQKIQNWKINFMRKLAVSGERCSFQFIDPEVSGFVNQAAFVRGISDIKAPLRLSLYPYLSTYVENFNDPSADPRNSVGKSYNAGMDLKYGINDAFTLDMTLIPDFGQVQSDDRILNLSPFEQRFNENRAFFTEGLDLFRKAGIFYTRRVGGTPINYYSVENELEESEILQSNPTDAQLLNATKVSGRTSKGVGVGLFNAISNSTYATALNTETNTERRIQTSPLTNYNVVVVDKNLKNNSYISLINTNVWRRGAEYYDANVTGLAFDLSNSKLSWGAWGDGSFSQLLNAEGDNVNGLKYNVTGGKISGKLRFDLELSGISPDYDINDLGFNTRSNIKDYDFGIYFNQNDAWKSFKRGSVWLNAFYRTTYDSNAFSYVHFNSGFWAQTSGLWEVNMWTNYSPESHDYFEPRVAGRYMKRPGFYNMGWWVGSDSRKKLWFGVYVFGVKYMEEGAKTIDLRLDGRFRFSNKLSANFSLGLDNSRNLRGWADAYYGNPIIGRRNRSTVNNVVGAKYTFNEKMSLNLRARHYWTKVSYSDFYGLDSEGQLTNTDYDFDNDFNFNLLNVDFNFRWRFAPGSDLIFNWKNSISGSESNESLLISEQRHTNGLSNLKNYPEINSFSLKLIYFLNGQNFF